MQTNLRTRLSELSGPSHSGRLIAASISRNCPSLSSTLVPPKSVESIVKGSDVWNKIIAYMRYIVIPDNCVRVCLAYLIQHINNEPFVDNRVSKLCQSCQVSRPVCQKIDRKLTLSVCSALTSQRGSYPHPVIT
jgi:hypothetical protein